MGGSWRDFLARRPACRHKGLPACLQSRGELRARHVLPLGTTSSRHLALNCTLCFIGSPFCFDSNKNGTDCFFCCESFYCENAFIWRDFFDENLNYYFLLWGEKLHCNPCPIPGAACLGSRGLAAAAWSLWPPGRNPQPLEKTSSLQWLCPFRFQLTL